MDETRDQWPYIAIGILVLLYLCCRPRPSTDFAETPKQRGPLSLLTSSRRFRRWAAVGLIGLPALYVLSFGPVCWLNSYAPEEPFFPALKALMRPYWPLGHLAVDGWLPVRFVIQWWIMFWIPAGHSVDVYCDGAAEYVIAFTH